MRAIYLWGMACLCFLASCGSGGKLSSPNMSGRWAFSATPTVAFPATETGTGMLTQNGNSVTGTLALAGFPCATSAAISGTVNGTTLSFQFNENGQSVTFTGKANSSFTSASGPLFCAIRRLHEWRGRALGCNQGLNSLRENHSLTSCECKPLFSPTSFRPLSL